VKLLLDANLLPGVGRRLKEAGHDAIHVRDVGLLSAPDPEILQAAADSFASFRSQRAAVLRI